MRNPLFCLALLAMASGPAAAAAPTYDHLELTWLDAHLGPLSGDGFGLRWSKAVHPHVSLRFDVQRTEGQDAAFTLFGKHGLYELTLAANLTLGASTDLVLDVGVARESMEAIVLGVPSKDDGNGLTAGLGLRHAFGERVEIEAMGRYRNIVGDARTATDVRALLRLTEAWRLVLGHHADDDIDVLRLGVRWDL
jgi:hypothetical protein